ncbi:AcrR family transcriptional regulator [Actinoplanes octamycinicus]|uniref:AcrR family transcriptional regulator n=1 Tax=Actinoplanes octamycinicus TaxID=135948 RepID=A0A7W7GZ80_9ACTN|nr:TetR/AcrR family transcriptional regulator [Actinoplanes octamycinicus]MBB4741036.1 AcrR family transcriptional regulator [Actinoplanes octamycinicus]GIE55941.1 TetR family transcriptional regulator [Actinoplanes octamycinicus]
MDVGLRERKKLETRRVLWETALDLFAERGFDNVAMAEIAAAANVSKTTVFNYFGSKEDLVMSPVEEHLDEPARVVRDRAPGESPVAALRRHFLAALAARDAATGISDQPNVLRVQRLITSTPALLPRLYTAAARTQELLAAELATVLDEPTARLAAAQIAATRMVLVIENRDRVLAGEPADQVYPGAVSRAARAFDLLDGGLAVLFHQVDQG